MKVNTFIIKEEIQFHLFTDKCMNRTFADKNDKIEILISGKNHSDRFETTYGDLLSILKKADTSQSQSRTTVKP